MLSLPGSGLLVWPRSPGPACGSGTPLVHSLCTITYDAHAWETFTCLFPFLSTFCCRICPPDPAGCQCTASRNAFLLGYNACQPLPLNDRDCGRHPVPARCSYSTWDPSPAPGTAPAGAAAARRRPGEGLGICLPLPAKFPTLVIVAFPTCHLWPHSPPGGHIWSQKRKRGGD